jgi:hypothetical protein
MNSKQEILLFVEEIRKIYDDNFRQYILENHNVWYDNKRGVMVSNIAFIICAFQKKYYSSFEKCYEKYGMDIKKYIN